PAAEHRHRRLPRPLPSGAVPTRPGSGPCAAGVVTAAADLIPTWVDGRLVPFDKLAAHREGRRHRAVSVFLLADGRVLIQRRAMGKYHTPGLWANTCCTHPH